MSESSEPRAALDAAMSEREFAGLVEQMFHQGEWNFFHPYDARRSNTILDYIFWKDDTLAFAELKTERGKLSKDHWVKGRYGRMYFVKGQETVIAELLAARQKVYIWRPSHLPEIAKILLGDGANVL